MFSLHVSALVRQAGDRASVTKESSSPPELHFQHPHLTMGQIHSALAYYWDHKTELDQDIERRRQAVDRLQQTMQPIPLVERQ